MTAIEYTFTPPTPSELRFAPPADETKIVTKPTTRRTTAAQRNRDMANLRDDMLQAKRAAGSLVAAHLLGVLS